MKPQGQIFIRAFVEAASEDEVFTVARQLLGLIEDMGHSSVPKVKRYWKIPEYFEFSVEVDLPVQCELVLSSFADRLGSGWIEAGERCLVWDPSQVGKISHEKVRWAEIEYFDPDV